MVACNSKAKKLSISSEQSKKEPLKNSIAALQIVPT